MIVTKTMMISVAVVKGNEGDAGMTKDEFIAQCSLRGICSKKFALSRTKKDSEDKEYTERDIEEMSRKKDISEYFEKRRDLKFYQGALSTKRLKNRSAPNYMR